MIARAGGCRCGAVRYRAMGAPKFVGNCHCAACRRSTGAPFSTFVGYADDQVVWEGGRRAVHDSSPGVQRGFCPTCGTALSYAGAKWPGETHLFIGSFDAPDDLIPTGNVFTDEALSWIDPEALIKHG